jgi:transcriptional regulator with XRE-family HTH domain
MSRPSSVLPRNLAEARERAGLSREQVAVAIGRSWATVRAYELGASTPPADVLVALSLLLGASVDRLLGLEAAAHVA